MRISEMSSGQGLDALLGLLPIVESIISDREFLGEAAKVLEGGGKEDGGKLSKEEYLGRGLEKINSLAILLFERKRKELFGILGVLGGKSPEEIEKQSFITTLGEVRDLIKDKELLDFFGSCMGTAAKE